MDKQLKEIKNYIYDQIENIDTDNNLTELHQLCCNEDYFIIGRKRAKKFCDDEVFNIIDIIRDYEQTNFGKMETPLNPEEVANMFCYIVGDVIINEAVSYLDKKILQYGKDYYLWDEKIIFFKNQLMDIIDNMIVRYSNEEKYWLSISCEIPASYKPKNISWSENYDNKNPIYP